MTIYKITTQNIKNFLRKRKTVEELKEEIRLLKSRLETAKQIQQTEEEMIIGALKRGVEVMSKMYDLEIKLHEQQGTINWKKEMLERFPKVHDEIKAAHAKEKRYEELIVARR